MLETSKNADIKKDSLALYGLPEVCKNERIKKISLPRYPPTLRRPKKAHRGPVGGVMYKNRAILWERGSPPTCWLLGNHHGDRRGEVFPTLEQFPGKGKL